MNKFYNLKTHANCRPHNKYIPVPQTRSRAHLKPKTVNRESIRKISRDFLPYADPIYRFPPKPAEIPLQETLRKLTDLDTDINTDFEENSPYQEGVISETYQRPNRSYFQEAPELDSLINISRLVQKFLLKQADIDKILKIIQRKFLKRKTFTCNCEGDTGRLFNQPIING